MFLQMLLLLKFMQAFKRELMNFTLGRTFSRTLDLGCTVCYQYVAVAIYRI